MATFTPQPGVDNLVLTGKGPSVQIVMSPAPGVDSLVLTGKGPTVWLVQRFNGVATLPAVDAAATMVVGALFTGDMSLPAVTAETTFGYQGTASLPGVTASATLSNGVVLSGSMALPAATVAATGTFRMVYDGDGTLGPVQAAGTLLTGNFYSADIAFPGLAAEGTLFQTTTLSGSLTLPPISVDSTLFTGSFLAGVLELPAAEIAAEYSNAEVLTYLGWSVNAFTQGHGQYGNVSISGLGRLGNKVYAAMSDGLYLMEGDNDAGTPIAAEFLLGYEDFGNEAVKAQRVAYLGYTSDGPMELLARVDAKGEKLHVYSVEAPHETAEAAAPARIKLGRGLKGRYWQMGLRNKDGAYFHIERLGLGVWGSTRKR